MISYCILKCANLRELDLNIRKVEIALKLDLKLLTKTNLVTISISSIYDACIDDLILKSVDSLTTLRIVATSVPNLSFLKACYNLKYLSFLDVWKDRNFSENNISFIQSLV